LAFYLLAFGVTVLRPASGGFLLGFGAAVHLGAMVGRGVAISFLPLTNKLESFSAAALGVVVATLWFWQPRKRFVLPLIGVAIVYLTVALWFFPWETHFPPPLMRTIWYPLHVPLSFMAYGLWTAAAAAAFGFMIDRDAAWAGLIDRLVLTGFAFWNLSMICGGFWGVVAWGAYFMWDAKIIWSVVLWFFYGAFLHLRMSSRWSTLRWLRPTLALVGFLAVLIAYIGTSFLFGRSSHAF